MSGSRGFLTSLVLLGALLAPGSTALADGARVQDPVYVYYPRGDCRGDQIMLDVWDRERSAWLRHPAHPRIPVDSCQLEDAGYLLHEIRHRCVEPADSDPPPPWVVGVDVFDPEVMQHCAPDQLALPGGDLEIHVLSPAPGERVAAPRMEVAIAGSVRMDGVDGTDYDVLLVVDRSTPTREDGPDLLRAQLDAARELVERLSPRLGPVRLGIAAYPNMPPLPGSPFGTSARRVVPLTDDPGALETGLRQLEAQGASGFQTFGSAFDFAVAELAGEHEGSGARSRARKVLVIAADAGGERPFGPAAARDRHARKKLADRFAHARARRMALHVFALGGLAEQLAPALQEIFDEADAGFHRVLQPELGLDFFASVRLPQVTRVLVANRSAGGAETPARITASGRFVTKVAAAVGTNRLWARATLSDGASTEREWSFEFDDSVVKQLWLAAERDHMRRVREEREKRIDLEPQWQDPLPGVGAAGPTPKAPAPAR